MFDLTQMLLRRVRIVIDKLYSITYYKKDRFYDSILIKHESIKAVLLIVNKIDRNLNDEIVHNW